MIATIDFVTSAFARFNTLCFNGELPVPDRFVISRAKTFLGRLEFKNKRSFIGKIVSHYDYTFKISGVVDMPEQLLEDVVIHEMIHLYIASKYLNDRSAHGPLFRSMMDRINSTFGRHIAISHRSQGNSVAQAPSKYRILCVTTFTNGDIGITVCAKTRIFVIRRQIYQRYRVCSMDWYYNSDDFFARYPRSNGGTVYRISRSDLDTHLRGSVELVCDDYSLRPKK